MPEEELKQVILALEEMLEDSTVPRNVKKKISEAKEMLEEDTETSIKVNKALHELDDISNDVNLQSYTRAQIWNVVSLLEKV